MANQARAHVIISGRVQGVFFRMETKEAADRHDVKGWVKNKRDGTVEAVFEGERDQVDALLKWCEEGPPHANVDDVDVKWEACSGEFKKFDVRY
jgi:acylphosphatase